MRTEQEIIEYCKEVADEIFGFKLDVLLPYLSAENVKPFLRDDADLSLWTTKPLVRDSILSEMREYMEFAWDKVDNHRGLSAGRSVDKMQAWLWLLGDNETLAFAEDENNYPNYGAPILKCICEVYSFSIPNSEDVLRMAQGKPCRDGCRNGCVG